MTCPRLTATDCNLIQHEVLHCKPEGKAGVLHSECFFNVLCSLHDEGLTLHAQCNQEGFQNGYYTVGGGENE